jgi:hypothetical protein
MVRSMVPLAAARKGLAQNRRVGAASCASRRRCDRASNCRTGKIAALLFRGTELRGEPQSSIKSEFRKGMSMLGTGHQS